jgi:hypothetical protein
LCHFDGRMFVQIAVEVGIMGRERNPVLRNDGVREVCIAGRASAC